MTWLAYALLAAFFASVMSITAKLGLKDVNSNLATAIRTFVALGFAWIIVFVQKSQRDISAISPTTWVFLVVSGLATGLSWLFYFKALQMGEAHQVAPIDRLSLVLTVILAAVVLHEKVTLPVLIGALVMGMGALIISLGH